MKDRIQQWLLNNLKLQLSLDKTKITNLTKEPARFLGFKISNNLRSAPVLKKSIYSTKIAAPRLIKQRMSYGLFIDIDHERVTERLEIKKIIQNKHKPKPIQRTIYIPLKEHEIIQRYKAHMEGLFQYYWIPITYKSNLARYHYYLYYSCVKTIAARQKTTISKVISKYGRSLNYKWQEQYKNKLDEIKTNERRVFIPSYLELMLQTKKRMSGYFIKKLEKINLIDKDFLTQRLNLRTAYKTQKYCCICGTSPSLGNPIESHHIKSVKKLGQTYTGFDLIMRQLNSKQLVCCKTCHNNIHSGK